IKTGSFFVFSSIDRFSFIFFYSAFYWGIYEVINFRINNWAYENIISNCVIRMFGYYLSYATVIPVIILVKKNLQFLLNINVTTCENELKNKWIYLTIGFLMLLLVVLFPNYFFPLTWGFLFFILDPLNKTSIICEWMKNKFGNTILLTLSGIICGFLWEFWNYFATSKWIYTLPVYVGPKIFEMPIAGYIGFIPFALETEVFYRFINDNRLFKYRLVFFSIILISFLIFKFIDVFTVQNFIDVFNTSI
ncbi:MAG: hypothetical protein NZ870_04315, partial [bacterium]|nr:hypothetical protein [bacterium]